MRIKYKPAGFRGFRFPERKCLGTVIANNVIITSSMCCENMIDFRIIDSSGGVNGMVNGSGKYLMQGVHTGHGSAALYGATYLCKNGQRKNGGCKKVRNGKRRRRDDNDGEYEDMICIFKAPFNIVEELKMEAAKDRAIIVLDYYQDIILDYLQIWKS